MWVHHRFSKESTIDILLHLSFKSLYIFNPVKHNPTQPR